jgi:hypothetical protein
MTLQVLKINARACRQLGQADEAARHQTEADQWNRRFTRTGT